MTITLNTPYATFSAGASVDLDNATEAALVAQARAVYTVNPGSVFTPLTATEQQTLRKNAVATQSLLSGGGNSAARILGQMRLRKWEQARAAMQAGTRNARVLFVGESTQTGVQGSNPADFNGGRVLSYPNKLAALLTAYGLPASALDSQIGDQSVPGHGWPLNGWWPAMQPGANWLGSSVRNVCGGQALTNTAASLGSAAAELFAFNWTNAHDTTETYYFRSGNCGTVTVDVGAGVLQTLGAGTGALIKTVSTYPRMIGPVNVRRTAPGVTPEIILAAVISSDSTSRRVDILNAGWAGATSTFWNDAGIGFAPIPMIGTFTPDLTIIDLALNDAANAIVPSTTQTNIAALITAALVSGDVIVISSNRAGTAFASNANQTATYGAVKAAAAAALGVPFFDLQAWWQSFASATSLGFMTSDQVHRTSAGADDVAAALAAVLLSKG